MKNADLQIVLASSSPRRRDLLKTLGVHFQVVIPDIEEKPRDGEAPEAYVKRNSMEKSSAVASGLDSNQLGACLVVAADTVVVLGSDIPIEHVYDSPYNPPDLQESTPSFLLFEYPFVCRDHHRRNRV